jgi:hypothetical protein
VAAGVHGTHLLIDINGYFVGGWNPSPLNTGEFVGWQGNFAIWVAYVFEPASTQHFS